MAIGVHVDGLGVETYTFVCEAITMELAGKVSN